jgi:type IV pilus assembly protein PilB
MTDKGKDKNKKTSESSSKKLGRLLLDAGRITEGQLERCIDEQKWTRERLGETLVRLGYVTEREIAMTLSSQLDIPYTDFETVVVEPMAVELLPETLARKHLAFPLSIERGAVQVAMVDPLKFEALQDIGFAADRNVEPTVSTPEAIKKAIDQYYHLAEPMDKLVENMSPGFIEVVPEQVDDVGDDITKATRTSTSPPVIRMVNSIIFNAIKNRASDIHIEPRDHEVIVRERVDGLLSDKFQLPKWVQGAVTSRVKIIGKLDIAEKRVPQDGRVRIRIDNREVDLRISLLPIQYGESIVIRVLDSRMSVPGIDELGASSDDNRRIKSLIERPQGMVLVTGPTGSGKTFSLYAMVKHIQSELINIISLEEPIEYEMRGVKQVAINEKTGLTFSYGLRSVLRQDPDVILVGEMRDAETSNIAIQASMTGHLVLSTLHTNTAAGAITRLKNIGVQPYLIASSLNGVVAQRLVRRICQKCIQPCMPSDDDLGKLGVRKTKKGLNFFRGAGCKWCNGTGYRGRAGIFEVLVCDPAIRELITAGATESQIVKAAMDGGMRFISEDGMAKAHEGVTTVEELLRVLCFNDEEPPHLCSACGGQLRADFLSCPYCGQATTNRCTDCGTPREPEWKFCPYCMRSETHPTAAGG